MKIVNLALGLLLIAAFAGTAQSTIIYYGSGGGYYPSYGAQVSVGYYTYPSYNYGGYYNYGYNYPYYGYGYYNYPYYNYGYNYPYYGYGYSGYSYGGAYYQAGCHWASGYYYC